MQVPGLELRIVYRGLTVGTVQAVVTQCRSVSLGPVAHPLSDAEELTALGFQPAPGYDAVQAVVRRAGEAFERLGFLGAMGDPAAWHAGWQAEDAARALWTELEVHDAAGHRAPWRVERFYELRPLVTPSYQVELRRDEAGDTILAALRQPPRAERGSVPPAP